MREEGNKPYEFCERKFKIQFDYSTRFLSFSSAPLQSWFVSSRADHFLQSSPSEQVFDFGPLLSDNPESSLLTSFDYVFEGTVLNQAAVLGSYLFAPPPAKNTIIVKPGSALFPLPLFPSPFLRFPLLLHLSLSSFLVIVFFPLLPSYLASVEYDFRKATEHVQVLMDILSRLPAAQRELSPSVYSLLANKKISFDGFDANENLILTDFLPYPEAPVSPIKSITQSGWNPPPAYRRLAGDLFYLDVRTHEGTTFCVTASPSGFFINSTKQAGIFNPAPLSDSYRALRLDELLSLVSPHFKTSFARHLKVAHDTSSLDHTSHPLAPPPPFLGYPEPHRYAATRAEREFRNQCVNSVLNVAREREWLVEMRMHKQMPKDSITDRYLYLPLFPSPRPPLSPLPPPLPAFFAVEQIHLFSLRPIDNAKSN